MYAISTLLLVAREACRVHNLFYYISRLLKLSTMCESLLHGPHNSVDGKWGRSASFIFSKYQRLPRLNGLNGFVCRERNCKHENSGGFMYESKYN